MTSDLDTGWAIQAPDWAFPPYFILLDTVRLTRADAQAVTGTWHARNGETPAQGWRRAYQKGWRAIRVKVVAL